MFLKLSLRTIGLLSMLSAFAFTLVTCAQTPALQKDQPSEGEKLLLEMERKLLDAKSLRIKFEIERGPFTIGTFLGGGSSTSSVIKVTGVFEIADGNRCRTDAEYRTFNATEKKIGGGARFSLIADGSKLGGVMNLIGDDGKTANESNKHKGSDLPKVFDQIVMKSITRHGLYNTWFIVESIAPEDPAKKNETKFDDFIDANKYPRAKFKHVIDEKLADKDAIKIEFEDTPIEPSRHKSKVTIWLDATTRLPLRRVIHEVIDGKDIPYLSETYAAIEINPKIDPARFVVPNGTNHCYPLERSVAATQLPSSSSASHRTGVSPR